MATVEVMLDINSGLPNPSWKLSNSQIEELRRLVEASRAERRETGRESPGLGYRGFTVTNRNQEPGLPYRVQVYGGVLAVTETFEKERPRPIYYADSQGLESWLLRQAADHGYPEDITGP
jgi:hypothetical protein